MESRLSNENEIHLRLCRVDDSDKGECDLTMVWAGSLAKLSLTLTGEDYEAFADLTRDQTVALHAFLGAALAMPDSLRLKDA